MKNRHSTEQAIQPAVEVPCAFCHGKGLDPFGIMSPISTCQVCGGTGKRTLRWPTATCVFCNGTGVYPGSRMTCTTCLGIGTVEVPEPAETCICCQGTGRAAAVAWPGSPFSCSCCQGKGVVVAVNGIRRHNGEQEE